MSSNETRPIEQHARAMTLKADEAIRLLDITKDALTKVQHAPTLAEAQKTAYQTLRKIEGPPRRNTVLAKDNKTETEPTTQPAKTENVPQQHCLSQVNPEKKKRGRPRIHPLPESPTPKKEGYKLSKDAIAAIWAVEGLKTKKKRGWPKGKLRGPRIKQNVLPFTEEQENE
jgi:hypothetical protein